MTCRLLRVISTYNLPESFLAPYSINCVMNDSCLDASCASRQLHIPDKTSNSNHSSVVTARFSFLQINLYTTFIRHSTVTDAACHDGAMLRHLVTGGNSAPEVWAGTAYRSQAHEAWLADQGLVSRIHHQKLAGSYDAPADRAVQRPQAPAIRATVEHVFAHQKRRRGCSSASSACRHQDRAGQSRLQLPASGLPPTPGCHGMIPSARPPNRSRNTQYPPPFHSNRLLIRLKTHICRRSLHIPCFERCLLARCSSARLLVENRDEQNVADLQYDLN